jgi:hypothetical protein
VQRVVLHNQGSGNVFNFLCGGGRLTPWRDSNPGSSVLLADAMTTKCLKFGFLFNPRMLSICAHQDLSIFFP